jgi:DNA-binding LytR/AlgR family response regulator
MILNCIIVDDEPVARKILADYIADVDFLTVSGMAENPVKAINLLEKNSIDLIFLDINMPKMSGIQFLRSSHSLPMAIITSAYTEFALEGFSLDVVDYLVKPFSLERFLKACNKARELFQLRGQSRNTLANYFFVKNNSKIEKVFYNELLYVEAMSNYVVLHTVSGKIIAYLTMKGILQELPSGEFLRVHKSFIVNSSKVTSIEGNTLDVAGHKIPIGPSLAEETIKKILNGRFLKR